jgi:hypothetical protein
MVIWDLGIAALGAPRLSAIGLALALRRRGIEEGSSPRFLVNGEREVDLGLLDGVWKALELPPPSPDVAEHALPRDLVRALDGEVFLITSDTATTERAARERLRIGAMFLVEERRMVLLLPGRGGDWVLEASVSATVSR